MIHAGACHCGDIRVRFETAVADPPLRACQCSFCRRHGAKTTSDPASAMTFDFTRPIKFYKFASRTADVIVCLTCGAYIASTIDGPSGRVATLNVVGANIAGLADREAEAISYDGETPEAKRARRLAKWTPATIRVAGRAL